MTNREWMNGLPNEQFMKVIRSFAADSCSMCKYHYQKSDDNKDDDCGFCYDGQVAWLDMEHNDDEWDERDFHYCT